MTRKPLIPIALICSSVALATTLWADSAPPHFGVPWSGIFHDWEDQTMCMNNPYQGSNDGTELVANRNCDQNDPGSRIFVLPVDDHVELGFNTAPDHEPKCIDLRNSEQWDGNWITRYTCNQTDAQKWDWDGTSIHYHANPAYCISVNSDGRLVLWHCIGQGNQKFVVTDGRRGLD